jgi:hypothetical protein
VTDRICSTVINSRLIRTASGTLLDRDPGQRSRDRPLSVSSKIPRRGVISESDFSSCCSHDGFLQSPRLNLFHFSLPRVPWSYWCFALYDLVWSSIGLQISLSRGSLCQVRLMLRLQRIRIDVIYNDTLIQNLKFQNNDVNHSITLVFIVLRHHINWRSDIASN